MLDHENINTDMSEEEFSSLGSVDQLCVLRAIDDKASNIGAKTFSEAEALCKPILAHYDRLAAIRSKQCDEWMREQEEKRKEWFATLEKRS